MKNYLPILLLAPALTLAATKPGDVNTDNSGIVTPDIATGMWSTEDYSVDTNGDMVVCMAMFGGEMDYRSGTCAGKRGPNNQWQRVREAIPAGKTYVGFRMVSGYYGRRRVEIYWK